MNLIKVMKKNKKGVGQITIKHIGDKLAVCISGSPQELFNSYKLAEKAVSKLRSKYGRRNYKYKRKRKSGY